MKGDFSRSTFDRSKHYSSVRRQQGRVDVDADWNEQADIELHRRRTTSTDVIGASGGPAGVDAEGNELAGFEVSVDGNDLALSAGRYYVDGILVENEAATTLRTQPDLAHADGADNGDYGLNRAGTYVAYLDVWEHHETHLDDDAMREVALNGPDTASRTRVVWQVRLQKVTPAAREDPLPCAALAPGWTPADRARTPGTLAARAEPDPAAQGPCVVPARARYRGLENQLYRVEVHAGGNANAATFKWSRENGNVVTRCDAWNTASKTLVVSPLPHAAPLGFAAGDWVELIADAADLRGEPGLLVELADAQGDRLELTADPGLDPTGLKVWRWEVREGESEPLFRKSDGDAEGWVELEDGVQVRVDTGDYRTGDYWLIPARTATGDVEWPADGDTPRSVPPAGIVHHFAPLAVVIWNGRVFSADVDDRRRLFPPLTALARRTCCTVTVGNGVTSCGDFNDLNDALVWAREWQDHHGEVPVTICLLAGVHTLAAPVILAEYHDLTIHGCGPGTRVEGPSRGRNRWSFQVVGCTHVRIEAFTLVPTAGGRGIQVAGGTQSVSLMGLAIMEGTTAIDLAQCQDATVEDCTLSGGPRAGSGLRVGDALRVRVMDCAINRVHASGALYIGAKARAVEVTGCTLAGAVEADGGTPALVVAGAQAVGVRDAVLSGMPAAALQGRAITLSGSRVTGAGLHILEGSEAVTVDGNEIGPGAGPGVVLGGAPADPEGAKTIAGVMGVDVRANRITGMTGSGIRTDPNLAKNLEWGEVEGVTLAGNRIEGCATAPDEGETAPSGIAVEAAVDLTVSDNVIRDNRRSDGGPVFGILVNGCENLAVTGNRVADNGAEKGGTPAGKTCIEFSEMEPGDYPTPATFDHVTFTAFAWNGQPADTIRVQGMGGYAGLNVNYQTLVTLPEPVSAVALTMVHFNPAGASAQALDSSGAVVAEGALTDQQGVSQTLELTGADIRAVKIVAGQNEALLLRFCRDAGGGGGGIGGWQAGIAVLNVTGGGEGGPAAAIHGNAVSCLWGQALLVASLGGVVVADNRLQGGGRPLTREGLKEGSLTLLQAAQCVLILNVIPGLLHALAMAGTVRTTYHRSGELKGTATIPPEAVLFHGNHLHQEVAGSSDVPGMATVVVGAGDVAVADNQFLCTRVEGVAEGIAADLVVSGASLRARGNRLAEPPRSLSLSALTYGVLGNITSENQAEHCILPLGNNVVNRDNQMFVYDCSAEAIKLGLLHG